MPIIHRKALSVNPSTGGNHDRMTETNLANLNSYLEAVTDAVTDAQNKIELLQTLPDLETDLLSKIKKVLSDLKMGIGQKALDCFTYNKER